MSEASPSLRHIDEDGAMGARLQWLVDEGYVPALRRLANGIWTFSSGEIYTDDGVLVGLHIYGAGNTAFEAIDAAREDAQRASGEATA